MQERSLENGRQTGLRQSKIAQGFWPATETSENVSGWPVCPRFHARPADPPHADPRPARVCRQAGLDHRYASEGSRFRRCRNVQLREKLLDAARRREIDVVLVWRLDRWGRSVADLLATLQELDHLGVGFVSLTEALDLTTPAGRAMAALLAVFAEFEREILRERVRAGLAHARQNGTRLGRPQTAALQTGQVRKLYRAGVSKAEIARRLQIGRTSVRRILKETTRPKDTQSRGMIE